MSGTKSVNFNDLIRTPSGSSYSLKEIDNHHEIFH